MEFNYYFFQSFNFKSLKFEYKKSKYLKLSLSLIVRAGTWGSRSNGFLHEALSKGHLPRESRFEGCSKHEEKLFYYLYM